jgi:N-acetylmuramoyl-L-alanine amidase
VRAHVVSDDRSSVLAPLVGAGLVATTLAVAPGVPHSFETPKEAVVALTVGAGLVLAAFGPTVAPPRAVLAPLAAFVAIGVAASAVAGVWTHAVVLDGVGVLLFVLGITALASTAARAQVARLLVIIASVEAVLAAVQLALGPAALVILGSAPRRAYAFGTLGVPNWVGALCAMALPPVLLAPSRRRLDSILVALLVVGLVVSGSRAAWLAALGAVALVGTRGAGRALVAGAIAGGLLVAATAAQLGHGPGSVSGRLLIWRATAGMIAAHPVLGVGPGGFAGAYPAALHDVMRADPHGGFAPSGFVVHPHDLLLGVTAERGVVGLAAFLWLVVATIRVGRSRDPTDWTRSAAAGTLAAFFVYGLFDHPFASTALAMTAWLAAAAWIAPDEAAASRPTPGPIRLALAVAGIAVAAYGLAALSADRRLAVAWEAAAGGDAARAAEVAATVRVGPARDDAYRVRGLAALGAGEPTAAFDFLAAAGRTVADADLFYATAAARTRSGDLDGGLTLLERLAVALPDLVGPHVVGAELRRDAGADGVDEALSRALGEARETAPNPRLDVLVALAAARRRDRRVGDAGAPLVVVDAGHGGDAAGARGDGGAVEKDITLQLAKPLAAALRARGARVVLTRARDQAVPLDARARVANTLGADLFLSLHANATSDPAARGIEIYLRASDFEPEAFPQLSVRDRALLVNVLPDGFGRAVAARRTLDRCALDAAVKIGEQLAPAAGVVPAILPARFYLLRQVQAPAVLVELGYLTNRDDARRLRRPSYRRALATALADGAMRTLAAGCRP